jgi:hypothetical protein
VLFEIEHLQQAGLGVRHPVDLVAETFAEVEPDGAPVGGDGKDEISANKQYATIDDQVSRFLHYLIALSPWQALNKAGVLSENFWLRAALSKTFCCPA